MTGPFTIVKARSYEDASEVVRGGDYRLPVLKAGGMDVVDHLKEGLYDPDALVNIKGAGGARGRAIEWDGPARDRIRIGAEATLADIAASELIREHAPAMAHAAGSAATPQVRNVASAAGNLLQRPRCWYYRNQQFDCLKKGGSVCYASEGENKYHAIFGGGPCHIVHPSNIAVPLVAMNGEIRLVGSNRSSLSAADLFHLPRTDLLTEHTLEPGEVISEIVFDASPTSAFEAAKEKQSFDWPLVFAVASVTMDGDRIGEARVCAGAVAPTPWPLPRVAEALRGVRAGDREAIAAACERSTEGADPMSQNRYKVRLLPVAVRRAVERAIA